MYSLPMELPQPDQLASSSAPPAAVPHHRDSSADKSTPHNQHAGLHREDDVPMALERDKQEVRDERENKKRKNQEESQEKEMAETRERKKKKPASDSAAFEPSFRQSSESEDSDSDDQSSESEDNESDEEWSEHDVLEGLTYRVDCSDGAQTLGTLVARLSPL
ncbi:hypothetical protein GYMLUDRAFT_63820 [Collybiopsis luxurians FD-317 M1]|uniref:Uncharacterized protein n=1 Tax=Collybiopsis luxurians FD-317 M1 TaxID=944289 RepID=A0A0D0CE91_9AGAR|nr:hypothetical protein GYMLUDRAFT_63820 [Collybiopsis luxurians FD-317 M1]